MTVTQSSEFRIILYKEKKNLYSVLLAFSETPMCVQNSYNGMTPTSDFVWHLYYSVSLVTSVWSYRPTRVPTVWMKTKGFGFRYNLSSQTDSAHYVDVIEQITIVIKNEMRIRLVHSFFFLYRKQYFRSFEVFYLVTLWPDHSKPTSIFQNQFWAWTATFLKA